MLVYFKTMGFVPEIKYLVSCILGQDKYNMEIVNAIFKQLTYLHFSSAQ